MNDEREFAVEESGDQIKYSDPENEDAWIEGEAIDPSELEYRVDDTLGAPDYSEEEREAKAEEFDNYGEPQDLGNFARARDGLSYDGEKDPENPENRVESDYGLDWLK